jgi:hypothetical protein
MKHDEHDFEMFGELILLVIVMFIFGLLVGGIGVFVWWLIT